MNRNIFLQNPNQLLVKRNYDLKKILKVIDKGQEQICFLINSKRQLIATVTDGDLRRAIINGKSLSLKIEDLKLKKPIFIRFEELNNDISKLLNSRIKILPCLDRNNKLLGYVRYRDIIKEDSIRSREICILGCGYVGLTLALVMAKSGFNVKGYDINSVLINNLKKHKLPFYEKGINSILNQQLNKNLKVTSSISDIKKCDTYIISVGTPINSLKKPNYFFLKKSIESLSKILKKGDLIILRSTVPVGTSRKILINLIEKNIKMKAGKDFYVSFCPERTVEGNAIEELSKNPQIIGGYCEKSAEISMKIFNEITHTVINAGTLEAAELSKIIDNSYRDTIFAYSNQMSLLASKYNVNYSKLVDKINLGYSRNFVPKPSPGVGGPCLSKDPHILDNSLSEEKINYSLVKSARFINEIMPKKICDRINSDLKKLGKNKKKINIFITGLAFKGSPETSDLRNSTSIEILNIFKKQKKNIIYVHDYVLEKINNKTKNLNFINLDQGFKNSDVILILNNHKNYETISHSLLSKIKKNTIVFDAWQLLYEKLINDKNIIYRYV